MRIIFVLLLNQKKNHVKIRHIKKINICIKINGDRK